MLYLVSMYMSWFPLPISTKINTSNFLVTWTATLLPVRVIGIFSIKSKKDERTMPEVIFRDKQSV